MQTMIMRFNFFLFTSKNKYMNNVLENIRYDVKNWWWFLITGILFIATGVIIFARPAEGYIGLSVLFSVVMMSSGIGQILFSASNSSIMKGWGWIFISGLIDLALGTYLFIYPVVTMATLPFFIGFWLVFRAFSIMGFSFDLKNFNVSGWGWVLFGGLVTLVCGGLIIYYPAAGVVSIIAVSGLAFIVGGILNIYVGFQLKSLKDKAGQIRDAVKKIKGEYKHA
jgi:uncharacterized membrane protein HdeD (DUF308 family)